MTLLNYPPGGRHDKEEGPELYWKSIRRVVVDDLRPEQRMYLECWMSGALPSILSIAM